MAHISVRHSWKLQSLHVYGNRVDDNGDGDEDDDGGEVVAPGTCAVKTRIILQNKTIQKTNDCLYSTGIPLKKLDLLLDHSRGVLESLSVRDLPLLKAFSCLGLIYIDEDSSPSGGFNSIGRYSCFGCLEIVPYVVISFFSFHFTFKLLLLINLKPSITRENW